jgi:hypothetical protein
VPFQDTTVFQPRISFSSFFIQFDIDPILVNAIKRNCLSLLWSKLICVVSIFPCVVFQVVNTVISASTVDASRHN